MHTQRRQRCCSLHGQAFQVNDVRSSGASCRLFSVLISSFTKSINSPRSGRPRRGYLHTSGPLWEHKHHRNVHNMGESSFRKLQMTSLLDVCVCVCVF
jgi:hypothetical protein